MSDQPGPVKGFNPLGGRSPQQSSGETGNQNSTTNSSPFSSGNPNYPPPGPTSVPSQPVSQTGHGVYCPSCGSKNPVNARYCGNCQAVLPTVHSSIPNQPYSYVSSPPPPVQYVTAVSLKNKSTATILEILPGLFGFLGFGWIYAGNTSNGIAWLAGFFIWNALSAGLSAVTVGIWAICWVPLNIAAIALSTSRLNTYINQHPELFGP